MEDWKALKVLRTTIPQSIKSGNSDVKKGLERSEGRKEGSPLRKGRGEGSKVVYWKLCF